MSCDLSEIKYLAFSVMDLTKLKPVELLLVQEKISSRETIQINKTSIDRSLLLL